MPTIPKNSKRGRPKLLQVAASQAPTLPAAAPKPADIITLTNARVIGQKINDYFSDAEKTATIGGFCNAIGISFKDFQRIVDGDDTLLVSQVGVERSRDIIRQLKKALNRFAEMYENTLRNKGNLQIGHIFLLKQLGFKDKDTQQVAKDSRQLHIHLGNYGSTKP